MSFYLVYFVFLAVIINFVVDDDDDDDDDQQESMHVLVLFDMVLMVCNIDLKFISFIENFFSILNLIFCYYFCQFDLFSKKNPKIYIAHILLLLSLIYFFVENSSSFIYLILNIHTFILIYFLN